MVLGLAAELKLERVMPWLIVDIFGIIYNLGLFLTAAPPLALFECSLSFFFM